MFAWLRRLVCKGCGDCVKGADKPTQTASGKG
jgi:hypothetical protein